MAKKKAKAEPVSDGLTFIQQAMKRWETANTAEAKMRLEGEIDGQFLNLDQWDKADKDARESSGKPTLTIDQIGEPFRQGVGQMRGAKPTIQVNPVDSGADQDTAEVFQGLIRHIEITGGAKAARDESFKSAFGIGLGYHRILAEFANVDQDNPEAIFDQSLRYQAIDNPFIVFMDPATPPHRPEESRFCHVIEDIPKDEFERRWPGKLATSQDAFSATGISMPEWFPEGSVRVSDYYYVEEGPDPTLPEYALLADGQVVPAAEIPEGAEVVQRRHPISRTVRLAKITGAEILEGEGEQPTEGRKQDCQYIPVIPMYGESMVVKGQRTRRGIVRSARDSQRQYNYHNSELTYELALAPKSKVIMAEGQDEGYEKMWEMAPTQAFPALKYRPVSLLGQPVPAPQIAQFTDSAKIQSLVVAINQNKADLRSTTGWYDATDPGRRNADQSGKAILARKESQSEGAITYKENFGQALMYEALVLLDWIPKVYARPGRVLRIVGLEDESKRDTVTVGADRETRDGVRGIFEWGAGRYDVTVSIGASYTSRRQEGANQQIELMKILDPQMRAAMAPITIRNMDWPGARETADQVEKVLPPELRADEGRPDGEEPDPQQLMQAIQQAQAKEQEMMQVIQGLQKAISEKQVEAESAMAKQQAADQVKMQIEQGKAQIEQMKVQASERAEAMALLMKQAAQESADSVKGQQIALEQQKLQAEIDMHREDIENAYRIAQMNNQTKLDTAQAPGRRKTIVKKTINRGPNGEAIGADEIHEELDEPS